MSLGAGLVVVVLAVIVIEGFFRLGFVAGRGAASSSRQPAPAEDIHALQRQVQQLEAATKDIHALQRQVQQLEAAAEGMHAFQRPIQQLEAVTEALTDVVHDIAAQCERPTEVAPAAAVVAPTAPTPASEALRAASVRPSLTPKPTPVPARGRALNGWKGGYGVARG